jgi:3-deoxy-D-manno-octulosonic-acid transferase
MRLLYNILFTLYLLVVGPFYLLKMWRRGNWMVGFGQRFGRYSSKIKQAITNRHVLWIHAVSVGEVNICTQLIRELEPRVPNLKIVVSTTTSTGMGELNRKLPSHIQKIYYPIDRRSYVCRALATIHPEAIVLVEAELWPNFLWRARDWASLPFWSMPVCRSDPIAATNLSRRCLLRSSPPSPELVAKNEGDAERLRALGFVPLGYEWWAI